ncbi:MAG: nucleotide exchange factor GrpE [Pseudonocardiales bacterium]
MTTAQIHGPSRTPLRVWFAALLGATLVTLLASCVAPTQSPPLSGSPPAVLTLPDPTLPAPTPLGPVFPDLTPIGPKRPDPTPPGPTTPTNPEPAETGGLLPGTDQGSDTGGGPTGVILGALGAAVLAGAALLVVLRRRRPPVFAELGSGAAPLPMRAETTPGPQSAPRGAQDVPVLAEALRAVAAVAPGAAIRQQIERLLEADVSRDDLLLACIRYRDQLAERDPATGNRLLAALRGVGVDEIRVDGELFDTRHHESVDVTPAPRPELHDHVAQTTRLGYRDGARVVRLPQVVVYRFVAPGASGGQL